MSGAKGRIVLIAMDGSECSNFAYEWYLKHLHRHDDRVILLHCAEHHQAATYSVGFGDASTIASQLEEEKAKAKEYLRSLTNKMKTAELHGKVKQVHGRARDEILRVAEEEKATFIISGTRGLGKVRRTLLGSVSTHVLHHAHIPVFIVKDKTSHHHQAQQDQQHKGNV